MFDFEHMALTPLDLNDEKTVFYINDFLVSEAITMIYGAPSQGKTWFMLAIAKFLSSRLKKIFYIDFDNPKRQLKQRGVNKLIEEFENIKYFSKGGLSISASDFLQELNKNAYGQNYKDCVFIIDSTRDFVDNIHNDTQAKTFMQIIKNIRDAGGTVVLIHHATKNGKVIDGSSEFTKSADNVYELKQKAKIDNEFQWNLKVENDRDAIKDCGFCVDTKSLELKDIDPLFSAMNSYEEDFVLKAKESLNKSPMGLNKTQFLQSLGYKRVDVTARNTIEKFTNIFWKAEKNKNKIIYTLV